MSEPFTYVINRPQQEPGVIPVDQAPQFGTQTEHARQDAFSLHEVTPLTTREAIAFELTGCSPRNEMNTKLNADDALTQF